MSKLITFVSATIVLFLSGTAGAAPSPDAPSPSTPAREEPSTVSGDNVIISEPPDPPAEIQRPESDYYSYPQALTFRYGQAWNFPKIGNQDNVLGFQFLFPKFLSPKLEAGADLREGGVGHLHAGVRYIANEKGFWRASGKVGMDHRVKSSQNLASFSNINNYFLRTSGAVEYTFSDPYSLRPELELLFGSKETILMMTLGVSRAW